MGLATNRKAVVQGLLLALGTGVLLGGCASGGGGEAAAPTAESGEAQAEAASPAPVKGVAPPAGHPMAKVELKMRPEQVREILGEPDSQHTYPGAIWKRFIPYYYGADSGARTEYAYAGQGRVVFTINRYSHQLSVVRIDYDPNETGN